MKSVKKQFEQKEFRGKELHKSAGILDDFSVRKSTCTREAEIESLNKSGNTCESFGNIIAPKYYVGSLGNTKGWITGYKPFAVETMEIFGDEKILIQSGTNDITILAGTNLNLRSTDEILSIGGDLIPESTYDLGSSSYPWGSIYINTTSGTYKFIEDGLHLALMNTVSGQQTQFNMYAADGDGTDGIFINLFSKGTISDHSTNYEKCVLQYGASSRIYTLKSLAGGTGTVLPIYFGVGAYTDAVILAIDGTTTIKNGIYNSSDGTAGMTGSKSFVDATARTNTITIKNGLITAWSQC